MEVSKSEFKARALAFFRHVESTGEPIIITDHGRAALEIRPYRERGASPVDLLRGSVVRYDDPTAPVGATEPDAAS